MIGGLQSIKAQLVVANKQQLSIHYLPIPTIVEIRSFRLEAPDLASSCFDSGASFSCQSTQVRLPGVDSLSEPEDKL